MGRGSGRLGLDHTEPKRAEVLVSICRTVTKRRARLPPNHRVPPSRSTLGTPVQIGWALAQFRPPSQIKLQAQCRLQAM